MDFVKSHNSHTLHTITTNNKIGREGLMCLADVYTSNGWQNGCSQLIGQFYLSYSRLRICQHVVCMFIFKKV